MNNLTQQFNSLRATLRQNRPFIYTVLLSNLLSVIFCRYFYSKTDAPTTMPVSKKAGRNCISVSDLPKSKSPYQYVAFKGKLLFPTAINPNNPMSVDLYSESHKLLGNHIQLWAICPTPKTEPDHLDEAGEINGAEENYLEIPQRLVSACITSENLFLTPSMELNFNPKKENPYELSWTNTPTSNHVRDYLP